MECRQSCRSVRVSVCALLAAVVVAGGALALEPKDSGSYLDQKEFFKPELYISSSQEPLEGIINRLPNRARWQTYLAAHEEMELATAAAGAPSRVPKAFIDPRSGAATSLIGSFPLIPGRGAGNHVKLAELGMRLGRDVQRVDPKTVADLVQAFVHDHADVLGVDLAQMGTLRAVEVTPELWQVSIPQTYNGVPVRYGRLAASLNNGNLVLIGTETWGNVKGLSHIPKINGQQAIAAGYAYIGGSSVMDEILRQPTLEVIPVSAGEGPYDGPVGKGYNHRLVWTWELVRPPDLARWELIVDAHDGEVLAFQDLNHYANHSITGGVYPLTDTGICPTPQTCGTMQTGWPMPFADTGLVSPNNFTNSGGIFNWTSGTTTTTLTGRYVDVFDNCGAISNSSTTGSINLGGVNNDHDCTTGGGSAGNTAGLPFGVL